MLARMAGASIPLTPAVHQMIDVGPTHWFADTKEAIEFPIVRDMDTNMYERQEGRPRDRFVRPPPILYGPEDLPWRKRRSRRPTPFTQEDFTPRWSRPSS